MSLTLTFSRDLNHIKLMDIATHNTKVTNKMLLTGYKLGSY